MRRRFFVDEVRNGHAHIEGDAAKHLTNVLRLEVGQKYEISDNRQAWLAEVESARKSDVVFRTLEKLLPEPQRVRVTLCAALVKFDHFEWMIEKTTELGVAEIVPVIATRTERGLDKAAEKRVERWRRIGLEASQQSRRQFLPEIPDAVPFRTAVQQEAKYRYVLDEVPGGPPLLAALPSARSAEDSVALLVGPEGGWAADELSRAARHGQFVSLGARTLRADEMPLAAVSSLWTIWRGW